MAMPRGATRFVKFVLTPFLLLACAAQAAQKCEAPDGSVTYADVCPAGTKHVPSTVDPPPPPQHKGTAIIKPDPLQGFKPVPPPAPSAEPASPKAPSPGLRLVFYDIEASNEDALVAALAKRRLHAESSWRLLYEYKPRLIGSRCAVATVTTALELAITLPRWSAPPGTDAGLVERWERYVEALRRHEDSRLEYARELEAELGPALMALAQAPNCDALAAEVTGRYETLLARARAREADFAARAKRGDIAVPQFR